jgi:hypothetical protein
MPCRQPRLQHGRMGACVTYNEPLKLNSGARRAGRETSQGLSARVRHH